jgi:hypothetical protein
MWLWLTAVGSSGLLWNTASGTTLAFCVIVRAVVEVGKLQVMNIDAWRPKHVEDLRHNKVIVKLKVY